MKDPELKEKIIKLRLEEGRTGKSLAEEFGVNASTIYDWIKQYQKKATEDANIQKQIADMKELRRLKEENEELKKENDFLKKAAAFFAKESKQ